jgi:hypothetical protein
MIPPLEENGYLAPGIHPATLDEIEARFGRDSELRRVQADSLRWLINLATRAGVERIVLDGSFVTDAIEPNDIDCVLLIGPHFPNDASAARELVDGLPFLDLELVEASEFSLLVMCIFATDRNGVPKGLVEVIS